ncbi:hypothetical protein [Cellulomonas xiejunii]|uniref:hypothetical protein n=1 Tax=Cellulomonas xiejunii TaxID=2968083 RepID=UPI001D0E2631|nr:hypothetical protein [Cellulomonas xiejunii]MCC2313279.1 hypothetical protein [Cellulomonas xiejunii]
MTLRPTPDELQVLGSALAAVAPAGWSRVSHVAQTVGPTTYSTTTAQTPSGEVELQQRISMDARRALTQLRKDMYRPGAGTWFTATITVYAEGRITTDFDYDNEPAADFAPLSWADDAQRFPRTPQNTPTWLAAKTQQPEWVGARWQFEFTADGAPLPAVDATTTEQGHAWCTQIEHRLREAGHTVARGTDTGEDGQGNDVEYDELNVTLGTGYTSLSFFRDEVFWSTEVWPDEVDQGTFTSLTRDILTAVRDVTGYDIGDQPTAYDRKLLGPGT